ncbi:MAG: hypothetical protein AABZ64_15165, partial [Nitrospinota bacterium]
RLLPYLLDSPVLEARRRSYLFFFAFFEPFFFAAFFLAFFAAICSLPTRAEGRDHIFAKQATTNRHSKRRG